MKRKHLFALCSLAVMLGITGCGEKDASAENSSDQKTVVEIDTQQNENSKTETSKTIHAMDSGIDLDNLTDAMVNVAFTESEDAYMNEDDAFVIRMDVYAPAIYDAVEMQTLEVGDTLNIMGEDIKVESKEDVAGSFLINGGMEKDGYEFRSNDGGTYVVVGTNDQQLLVKLGSVTLPVDQEFRLIDQSDLDKGEQITFPGDMITEAPDSDTVFQPENTIATIENGYIKTIEVAYMP